MTRAQRLSHILKLTADLQQHRDCARSHSNQPLALIKKHPVITMTTSALILGMFTRLVLAAPLSATVKLLGIPVVRSLFPVMVNYLMKDSASMRAFIDCQYRAFRDLHR